ncbi:hypothetical protein [Parageobacillus thermoglucosidasius]|uniref:hypothetical protein n=1 Tax=Parageobacillus thermoglucosidasius TaxID=1426 RepID=UPI0011D17E94|nr:hypothetical protein [Parageobacillus thermoglucosidasius]
MFVKTGEILIQKWDISSFFSVKIRAFGAAVFMPGGEQSALVELFRENNESMSSYFHDWMVSKAYSWMS